MKADDDFILDRRAYTRVELEIPAHVRDASYVWSGSVRNLSTGGCLLALQSKLPIGKQVELELRPVGLSPTVMRGEVKHITATWGVGIAFDLRSNQDFERALEAFESVLATQPSLAVELKRRPTRLSKATKLWALPNSDVEPRPEERRILAYFIAGTTLGELERALGPKFKQLMYLPFSMLDRRLLSTVRPGTVK